MKSKINRNVFPIFVFVLLGGCSTVKPNHSSQPIDQTLHPVDCTTNAKREECLAVASVDKKAQKKTVKPTQSELMERRARLAKIAENKKINDEKAKAKNELSPLPQDDVAASKSDLMTQKKIDNDKREKALAASMDCVKNSIGKVDDVRKPVRAVAYELAVLCRKTEVSVDSVANSSIPLVSQTRVLKKTK